MRSAFIDLLPAWFPGELLMPEAGTLVVAGFLLTVVIALRLAEKADLERRVIFWAGTWGIIGALWGGHLIRVLTTPRMLIEDPLLLFQFMEGGKGVFGAFIGACLFVWLYLRWRRVFFLAYADAAVPAVALGYAVARIGCFLNGDDFGTLSNLPWAVRFPQGTDAFASHLAKGWVQAQDASSLPVHPVQLYHAAAGVALFLILRRWRGGWHGSRLAVAAAGYGVLRFALQFFRGDSAPFLWFLDNAQILSLMFLLSAFILWAYRGEKLKQPEAVGSLVTSTSDLTQEKV